LSPAAPRPAAPPSSAAGAASGECRCLCGSLLARWVEDGVELKCRRCKRTLRVPLSPEPRSQLRPVRTIPAGGEPG
jgi:phage FluMu protein Com